MNPHYVNLEQLKWALIKVLNEKEINAIVDISEHFSFIAGEIAIRAYGHVWAEEKSVQRKEIKYPADWRQHFKLRWFPQWALNKWPVKITSEVLDVKCIYPAFKPKLKDQEFRLIVVIGEGDE